MAKIIKEYRFEGNTYTLQSEKNGIKYFGNGEDSIALIVDENDNVLFKIVADCAQNTGFLTLSKTY
tara:strand:- start:363 stop:560 length:198 start_codon:yes stop_codon:yes gene_type:complete